MVNPSTSASANLRPGRTYWEDLNAQAARLLDSIVDDHAVLRRNILDESCGQHPAETRLLMRRLRVQDAIVRSAIETVDELKQTEGTPVFDAEKALLAEHQKNLVAEMRGLADRSLTA